MNVPQLPKKKEKKRMAHSIVDNVKIISFYVHYVSEKSTVEIAKLLNLRITTLQSIVERRSHIERVVRDNGWNLKRYHIRRSAHPLIDRALYIWMNNIYENPATGMIIDGASIKCAAENFESLFEENTDLSESLIRRWRERYNIKNYYSKAFFKCRLQNL
jgi:transposase